MSVFLVGAYSHAFDEVMRNGWLRPARFFSYKEARRYADWVMKTYPSYGKLWISKEG